MNETEGNVELKKKEITPMILNSKAIGVKRFSFTYQIAFIYAFYINLITEIILVISSFYIFKENGTLYSQLLYCTILLPFTLPFCFCPIGFHLAIDFNHGSLQIIKYNLFKCTLSNTNQLFALNTIQSFTLNKMFIPFKKFYQLMLKDIEGNKTIIFTAQDIKGSFCCSRKFDPKIDEMVENLNKMLKGEDMELSKEMM